VEDETSPRLIAILKSSNSSGPFCAPPTITAIFTSTPFSFSVGFLGAMADNSPSWGSQSSKIFKQDIPQKEWGFVQHPPMRQTLDNQLAVFLRKRRGGTTYAVFARKLGITPSSLHRLENGQQSVTLKTLQQIMDRLHCGVQDVFPPRH
jgi:DNA-binding Xre family transcriptional regulator